jgi:hydroxypyruvate reductase
MFSGANFSLNMREVARQIFTDTLNEIAIPRMFNSKVAYSRGVLRVEDDLYDLGSYSRVLVIAMGKAAHSMLESLIALTGPTLEGIVVSAQPPATQLPGFRYFLGGHPLPTAESMRAAQAILKTVSGHDQYTLVIYLISGGASAMVEVPGDDEITLEDLVSTYRVLVHSGASIGEINAIRKHLSAIKGGRLAQAASPARQVSIMISDVPEGQLDALASGPTMPDASTAADCYRIAEAYDMLPKLPASVRSLFGQRAVEETPKANDAAFVTSRWWPILSSASAAQAAAALTSRYGFAVEIDNAPDDWPYEKASEYLLGRLRKLRQGVSRAALISAGEITVKVPTNSGTGGRNQHFALHCAQQIAGEDISILSAGTDGIDGNSVAAGAVVDGSTVSRARATGTDPALALREFNSFPLFEKLGDAVLTGPTGNNVRDVRVLLAY